MPAQIYTFVDDEKKKQGCLEGIVGLMQSEDGNGTYNYVCQSADQKFIMPTFNVIDKITGLPRMRITFTLKVCPNQYEIIDLGLFIVNNPVEVTFIEKLNESNDEVEFYRIGIDADTEPGTVGTMQTLNNLGRTFSHVMEIETVNRHAVNGELEGTTQKVGLSAFPYRFSAYNSMDEINATFGFQKGKPSGPEGLKIIEGLSPNFTSPSSFVSKEKEQISSCLIGEITKTQEVLLAFGNEEVPCKIIWLKTGFGEIPMPVCATYDDYNEYTIGKYVCAFAYVKADFGQIDTNK